MTTPVGIDYDSGNSVAIQPDGMIVVGGSTRKSSGGNFDAVVVRYESNGQLDTGFNGTGIVTTPTNSGYNAHILAIQPTDGKIVVAGDTEINTKLDFIIIRYDTTGQLDTEFNGTGIVTTPVGTDSDIPTSIAIQPTDSKIVVSGGLSGGGGYSALVRYDNQGNLDSSFNSTGVVTTAFGLYYDTINSIAIQPSGKIVTAGIISSSDGGIKGDLAVIRYNSNGSLDSTFNGTGVVTTPIGSDSSEAYSVAIQSDSKIVVSGRSEPFGSYNFTTVRYLGDSILEKVYLPLLLKG